MKDFSKKLRLLFLPFFLIAICTIAIYTFLNWLLIIRFKIFPVNEEITNLWIPVLIAIIPLLIWIRPKLKSLKIKTKKGDNIFGYLMIATFAIGIPNALTQSYLESETGKMTKLESISQIDKVEATKYYTINNFYISKNHSGINVDFNVSGRGNTDFNMTIYVVMPILVSEKDTLNPGIEAWMGTTYRKTIRNRLSEKEKREKFLEFAKSSDEDFKNKDFSRFVYLERIGNTDAHAGYIKAINNLHSKSEYSSVVLLPVNEPFESRNGNKFVWIFGALAIGSLVWLLMVTIPKLRVEDAETPNETVTSVASDFKDSFGFFVPKKDFFVTPLLIDLNILIYLIMVVAGLGLFTFSASDLIDWGANATDYTNDGQWWRLLTNIFLHGGLMHLLANMIGLIYIGIILEPRLGRGKFTLAYFVSGILASIVSIWWHDRTVSVGASGAIFGLYGTLFALLLTKSFPKAFNKALLMSTILFIGYNLIMGLNGGIDNAAHIGGLLTGFVIGLVYSSQIKRETEYQEFIEEVQAQPVESPHNPSQI